MVRILFFLFMIFGMILLFQSSTKQTPGETEVFMTSSGFSSRKIEITAGSRITFTNRDKTDHWPASSFHPDHSLYPEFDAKKPVQPGDSWSFVPKRVGVFKFHDHLYHYSKALLIVLGQESAIRENGLTRFISTLKSTLRDFESIRQGKISPARFRKLSERQKYKAITAFIRQQGAESAWKFITSSYDEHIDSVLAQHNLAHFIGGKLFEEQGVRGLTVCTPLFIYGCHHGVMERALVNTLDPIDDAVKACEEVGRTNGVWYTSCLHGIGHGIASFVEPANLETALSLCDRMPQFQPSCHSGVFMEYATGSPTSVFVVDEMTNQNPLSFCQRLEAKYRLACVGRMIHVMEKIRGQPLDSLMVTCLQRINAATRWNCLEIVGMTVGERSRGNSNTVFNRCKQISDAGAMSHCVAAAVEKIVFEKYQGWETAASLCEKLPSAFEYSCRDRLLHPTEAYR